MPDRPVKPNETWTVDADKVVKSFESGGPFKLDKDTTKVTGKLVKVYDKGGKQFGVIEMSMVLGVKELDIDGQELAMKAGSKVTAAVTLDVCIDGSAHTGTEKGTMKFDLNGEIPNGTLTVKGQAKYEKVAEDLKAK